MFFWTNNYIKIPFKDRGRTEEEGVDCWGLARLIYKKELGIDLPVLEGYHSCSNRSEVEKTYYQESASHWCDVKKGCEKPFDVIVLRMLGVPMHVGVIVQKGMMIHCLKGRGVVVEDYNSSIWINRIESIHRHESCCSD